MVGEPTAVRPRVMSWTNYPRPDGRRLARLLLLRPRRLGLLQKPLGVGARRVDLQGLVEAGRRLRRLAGRELLRPLVHELAEPGPLGRLRVRRGQLQHVLVRLVGVAVLAGRLLAGS